MPPSLSELLKFLGNAKTVNIGLLRRKYNAEQNYELYKGRLEEAFEVYSKEEAIMEGLKARYERKVEELKAYGKTLQEKYAEYERAADTLDEIDNEILMANGRPKVEAPKPKPKPRKKMTVAEAFAVMELQQTRDMNVIRSKYRDLAKVLHPDRKDTGSEVKFKVLNEAHTIIKEWAE